MPVSRRFIVEGEWSGYRVHQRRVVHRTVHTRNREKYDKLGGLRFTDGTMLDITVRDCKPREKVQVINGYNQAIDGAIYKGLIGYVDIRET
jgi:hypothetical protein